MAYNCQQETKYLSFFLFILFLFIYLLCAKAYFIWRRGKLSFSQHPGALHLWWRITRHCRHQMARVGQRFQNVHRRLRRDRKSPKTQHFSLRCRRSRALDIFHVGKRERRLRRGHKEARGLICPAAKHGARDPPVCAHETARFRVARRFCGTPSSSD